MEQSFQKSNQIDTIANKVSLRALRCFYRSPRRTLGVPEIARVMGTSRASVHRRIVQLQRIGILRARETGHKKVFCIDSTSPLAEPFFELFNHERYIEVDPQVRFALDRLLRETDKALVRSIILFGSHARGLATSKSDVDLCIVTNGNREITESRLGIDVGRYYADIRLEPHVYTEKNFSNVPNLAVLDAILIGISLVGHHFLFEKRMSQESINKESLMARLEKSRENLERSRHVIGEARKYFEGIVEVSLSEIEAVISSGTTVPRRGLVPKRHFKERIIDLEGRLADMGEVVWLE
jgi:predicted nucleotidyltransferase